MARLRPAGSTDGGTVARSGLRDIARCQKGIILCIPAYLAAVSLWGAAPPSHKALALVAIVAVGLVAAALVFAMAAKLDGIPYAIFILVLSVIPGVNLCALLMVNGQATRMLKANGVKVGLLGANSSKI